MEIYKQRMTAIIDKPVVVFLIGMRFNRPLKIHKWWPVVSSMGKMLRELSAEPASGYLSGETWFGRTTLMVQYWSSFDALERYAQNRAQAHLPAWAEFNRLVGNNGDVGIWHETYEAAPGNYECVYHNMPRFGLGKVGHWVEANHQYAGARGRLRR